MRRVLAIATILAALSPLAALPASAIDCNGIGIFDCDDYSILGECTGTCSTRCEQLLLESGQIIDHPEYCTICAKVATFSGIRAPWTALLTSSACTAAAGQAVKQAICDKGPLNCCISTKESPKIKIGDEVCTNEVEDCGGAPTYYSCCVCTKSGIQQKLSSGRDTYDSCVKRCKDNGLDIYKGFGAGTLGSYRTETTPTPANLAAVNALCFTQAECAGPDYGGSPSAYRAGLGCPSGKGRCVAPEPTVTLNVPIGGATTAQGMRDYINKAFQYAVAIVAVAAAVMFVYGGFRYITGAAFGDFQRAKEIMIDSAVGLLLTLGAVLILNTVNPATTTLKMPEIYLINRQTIMSNKYCADLAKTSGGIKFADAGTAPDYKDPNTVTFDKTADDTICNQEYFADGFGATRCFGRSCKQLGPGFACADCTNSQGKIPECQQKNTGSVCIKAQWTGTITWGGTEKPLELVPFAVCGWAQGAALFGTVEANMFKMDANVDLSGATIKERVMTAGVAPYRITFSESALNAAKAKCAAAGSGDAFGGVVLGLKYQGLGLLGPAVATPVGAAVETLLPGTLSNGGYAIITQADCGQAGRFSGYADLDGGYLDAYWCALVNKSSEKLQNRWSEDDIAAAIDGTRSITCDLNLSNANAPDAPTTPFYGEHCNKDNKSKGQPQQQQNIPH